MSNFLSNFKKSKTKQDNYNLWELVDERFIEPIDSSKSKIHVICDIDKTYLETEFESIAKIAKIAFEGASEKRTVAGATDILLATRWGDLKKNDKNGESDYPRWLHFVSSSPPQLRKVLEEKMAMDGLDWSSDTFKDQAYNLKKGRFDLLKHQVGYKIAAILKLIERFEEGSEIYMIGDNAESDAFIYMGVKLLVEKRLSPTNFKKYIEIAGVENDIAKDLLEKVENIGKHSVRGVLIRSIKNKPIIDSIPLTDPIVQFADFFEAGLVFMAKGIIPFSLLWQAVRNTHNRHDMPLNEIENKLSKFIDIEKLSEKDSQYIKYVFDKLRQQNLDKGKLPRLNSASKEHLKSFGELTEEEILEKATIWIGKLE